MNPLASDRRKQLRKTMDLKNLFETDGDERAVSPVLGVILMVAITVILAAVIGAFVIGIGEDQEVQPSASFDFDFETSGTEVTVTHSNGDTISSPDELILVAGGDRNEWVGPSAESSASAGDQFGPENYAAGETVRVVWESETGDSSATLSSQDAPE